MRQHNNNTARQIRRALAAVLLCVLLLAECPLSAAAADDSIPGFLAEILERMAEKNDEGGSLADIFTAAHEAVVRTVLEQQPSYANQEKALAEALMGEGVPLVTKVVAGKHTYEVSEILRRAAGKYGKPYVFGAVGENSFDCSGFVAWLFGPSGVYKRGGYSYKGSHYPNSTAYYNNSNLSKLGVKIPVGELQPGDVVMYGGHVGVYIGDNMMINALGTYKREKGTSKGSVTINYISKALAKKNKKGYIDKTDLTIGGTPFTCSTAFSGTPKFGVRMYGQEFSDIQVTNARITDLQVHPVDYTGSGADVITTYFINSFHVFTAADVTVRYGSATLKEGKDFTRAVTFTIDPKDEKALVLGEKPLGTMTLTGMGYYEGVSATVELYFPQLEVDTDPLPPVSSPEEDAQTAPLSEPLAEPLPDGFPACLMDFTRLNYGQIRHLDWVGGLYTDYVGGGIGPGSWIFSANHASETEDFLITCTFPGEFEDDSQYPCSVAIRDFKGGQSYYSLDGSSSLGMTCFDFGVGDTSKMTAIPGLNNTAYAEFPLGEGWVMRVVFSDPFEDLYMPVMVTEAEIYCY